MANAKGWRRRPKDAEYTLDFAATLGGKLVAGCVEIKILRRVRACRVHLTHWLISTQVAGKRLYHPVKCVADAKLGALARGMADPYR